MNTEVVTKYCEVAPCKCDESCCMYCGLIYDENDLDTQWPAPDGRVCEYCWGEMGY